MKILHISDLHCSVSSLKMLPSLVSRHGPDVLVVSGDLECNEYFIDMLLRTGIPVLGVPGNMDDAYISRTMSEKGVNIDARMVELGGTVFMGIGGRAPLSSIRRIRELASEARGREIVLVSHHPPHGTRIDVAFSGVHAGLYELRSLIEEIRPKACLCGHIHESPGVDRIGETLLVNPGPFYEGRYAVVDLGMGKAWILEEKPY